MVLCQYAFLIVVVRMSSYLDRMKYKVWVQRKHVHFKHVFEGYNLILCSVMVPVICDSSS